MEAMVCRSNAMLLPGSILTSTWGCRSPIGVHNQNPRTGMRLLDHIRQVMPVILDQGRAEDHQIKSLSAQRLFEDPGAMEQATDLASFCARTCSTMSSSTGALTTVR
jgi:hypothetical protein